MILNRLTSKDDQEEWLRIRKRYLTGTDAGAVCGMNPYKSAIQVYLDKTTPDIEMKDNEAHASGTGYGRLCSGAVYGGDREESTPEQCHVCKRQVILL